MKAPASSIAVVFKLEGGTSAPVESPKYFTNSLGWAKMGHNFAAQLGGDYKRLSIFFNFGQSAAAQTWFIDNLKWTRAGYNGCIANFDLPNLSPTDWGFFENGNIPADQGFQIVDNPVKSGINLSQKVGKAIEAGADNGGSQVWGGMYVDLDAPLRFTNSTKKMRMKVLMPATVNVTMKLEGSANGAQSSSDNTVAATKIGTWEELEWDFSGLQNNADYKRITLIWNIADIPATNQTYFFDDILMVGGTTDCVPVGVFSPVEVGQFELSPNPASDLIFIKNLGKAARISVVNTLGQPVLNLPAGEEIDISRLPAGIFYLIGFDFEGKIRAKSTFIKQ